MTTEAKPAVPIWGVRHVAVRVKDLDVSRKWYEDVLCMMVEDEFPGRAFFVRFGPYYHHDLAIFKADPDTHADKNAVGVAHIALLVDSLEGVRQWYHTVIRTRSTATTRTSTGARMA
jgi:catechol-2,3-dioxygenase